MNFRKNNSLTVIHWCEPGVSTLGISTNSKANFADWHRLGQMRLSAILYHYTAIRFVVDSRENTLLINHCETDQKFEC